MTSTTRTTTARLAALSLVAGALVLGSAVAAQAHSAETGTSPERESTVTTELTEVSATFNEDLLSIGGTGTVMRLEGPDGRYYETSCGVVDGDTATASVAMGGPGEYTVIYRVVSADSHPIDDEFTFEYAPEGDVAVAEGAERPVCLGDGTVREPEPEATETATEEEPTATATETETPSEEPAEAGDSSALVAAGLIVGLLVVAGVVATVVVLRRKGSAE